MFYFCYIITTHNVVISLPGPEYYNDKDFFPILLEEIDDLLWIDFTDRLNDEEKLDSSLVW